MEDIFHLGIKALLRNEEGRVLLLKVNPKKLRGEQRDYWDLPGGRIQKGDSVLDTLRREVEEEIGVTSLGEAAEVGMVLSNIRIPLSDETSAGLILGVYACEMPKGANITLSDEHTAYDWFTPKEAAELLRVKYPGSFCDTISRIV